MKIKNPNKIDEARRALKTACDKYDKLVRDRRRKPHSQLEEHQKDCVRALAEKRMARIAVDCLMTGKPVPEAAEMPETKILAADKEK